MTRTAAIFLLAALASCSRNKNERAGTFTLGPDAATYLLRIGVGVSTGQRTCIAIHNANLSPGTQVTLISAILPQTTVQAEIGAASGSPCPLTKDVDPAVSNYDLHLPAGATLPKLTPLIAVTGTSAPFTTGSNNDVRADLDQNGKLETFRACSSNDGVHLTVWAGHPLTGTVLWHGYYYEPANPSIGPACTPPEMVTPQPAG